MTALTEYQRLDCPGLWRATGEDQRREVIVAFGDATLILKESPSERALTHWSLPALIRTNPGRMPALFSPANDADEALEIDDETMIAAITKVHAIIAARQPHPGRLRWALLMSVAAAIAGVSLFWLPGALITHTASVLPAAARQEISLAILADLQRLTGSPCTSPDAAPALSALGQRLLGPGAGQITVLPEGLKTTLHLPGNFILLSRHLLEDHDTPDVAAGYVLAEALRAEAADPLLSALHFAGLRATFNLLTTGDIAPEAFRGYGEQLLSAPPATLDDTALLQRFSRAGVGSSAYAYALDPSGEATLALIEADPFAAAAPQSAVLSDADWVALQGICSG